MSLLPMARLVEIAEVNPSLAESLDSAEPVSFVPMSAVTAETASTTTGEDRLYGEVNKGYTPFLDGDLLLAKITPCFENGKIAQARLSRRFGFGSTEFHVIRPRDGKADARYLLHFLRQEQIRRDGERRMTGSAGQRRVPEHFLTNLEVPALPLSEQRRIAEVLDRAEALRAKRRATLAQFDILTQSIFFDLFGDPGTNSKGWPRKQLGELMTEVYRYPTYYDIKYEDTGVPEIRGELLQVDGTITRDQERLRFISPTTSARFPRTVLAEGDLVMSVRGTIGKIGLVPRCLIGANITANLIRMAPDHRVIDSAFAWHFTQTKFFKGQLAEACSSTTILTIKAPDLKRILVIVPPLDAQREFVHRVAIVHKLKAAHETSLAQLNSVFAVLQHHAFRGEL